MSDHSQTPATPTGGPEISRKRRQRLRRRQRREAPSILPSGWTERHLKFLKITVDQLTLNDLLPGLTAPATLSSPLHAALLDERPPSSIPDACSDIRILSSDISEESSGVIYLLLETFLYFYSCNIGLSQRQSIRFGLQSADWVPDFLLLPFLAVVTPERRNGLAEECGTLAALAQVGKADKVWVISAWEWRARVLTATVNPAWRRWVEEGCGGDSTPAGLKAVSQTWDLRSGEGRVAFVSVLQAILEKYGGWKPAEL